ncbi:MAG TPA: ABC transporter substrate binding protein [Candidatus Competibacteraceae bacterium]|nr:ABC transporter substrate binding protein [Candidatus Competibacteraceae bacterium]
MMIETSNAAYVSHGVSPESPIQPKRLLILHSYHQGLNWTGAIQAGILESLSASGQRYEIFTEYLDALRFPELSQTGFTGTLTRLQGKYWNRQPDVVLVSDNHAYNFMLANRDRITPGKPLVFCGVNNLKPSDVTGLSNLTGVSEIPSFLETLQLIHRLQPNVIKLLVISDNSITGQANRALIREALQQMREPFTTEYWTDGRIDRAETLLRRQTQDTAVLLAGRQTDTAGNIIQADTATALLAKASPVPIYSSHDAWIGSGALGGKVIDGGSQGRLAGHLAARLLNGESIQQIQTVWESPNQYLFDYTVLQRFGLENANLPTDSIFLNRQPGFFEAYRALALGTGAVIMSLAGMVLILSINIKKRKETEQKYRDLVENANSIILKWGRDGRIIFLNEYGLHFFGYTEAEIIGQPVLGTLVSPFDETGRNLAEIVDDIIKHPGDYASNVNQNLRKNGEQVWVAWSNRTILDKLGNISGVFSVGTDITARKQAEAERERLIVELEAKNAELERFTYTVSHDLKSPLITIKGFLGVLEQDLAGGDTEQARSDMARIGGAADKMKNLLDDLLELSRIGRICNPPVRVPLAELAYEAAELLAGRFQQREVRLDVANNLPAVCGDRSRLLEVMQNLLDNAVKYLGEQPKPVITVGCRQDRGQMVCYVRDNGLGIEPCYHDKVFGLFEQLDPRTEGTGVGLALVKRIIEFHNGRLWVESAGLGQGSTFYFTLPLADSLLEVQTEKYST